MDKAKITLVTGGARSGKSAFAEQTVRSSGLPVTYIATAEVYDDEMRKRVELHKLRRPPSWGTWEGTPEALAEELSSMSGCFLMDCLTMWLTRLIFEDDRCEKAPENEWHERENEIIELLKSLCASVAPGSHLVMVTNETGMGIVPDNRLSRRFRDLQGRANQTVAAMADEVVFVVSGCPMWVKK